MIFIYIFFKKKSSGYCSLQHVANIDFDDYHTWLENNKAKPKIQPVKFTWKADAEKKPQVGVIAQSVQTVVPEAIDLVRVDKEDDTDYLSVRYTELIPLMIASIQALKAEVDVLKAQLNK